MDKGLPPILLTVFLLAFGMSFVSPLIPLLLQGTGASSATIGQIATTYFLVFTITSSFLGRWIEKAGSKKMIMCGLAIFGLAILAMPYMPGPAFFYLLRIIQGVGSALLFAPTEAAINILSSPERRGSNMGLYGVVFAVGFAVGPGIGSWLYAILTATPFIVASASSLGALLVLLYGFDETIVPVKKTEWGFARLTSSLRLPITAAACYAVVEVAIGSFLSLYLDAIGITGGSLGMVFTFFAIEAALVIAWGQWQRSDSFRARRLTVVFGSLTLMPVVLFVLALLGRSSTEIANFWLPPFERAVGVASLGFLVWGFTPYMREKGFSGTVRGPAPRKGASCATSRAITGRPFNTCTGCGPTARSSWMRSDAEGEKKPAPEGAGVQVSR